MYKYPSRLSRVSYLSHMIRSQTQPLRLDLSARPQKKIHLNPARQVFDV